MLDFDESLTASDKVLFFTYLNKSDLTKGRFEVSKYCYPACAPEMEVRFVLTVPKGFR
jgi:hypothetical protein